MPFGSQTYSILTFSELSIITALKTAFMNITSSTRQTHLAPLNLAIILYHNYKRMSIISSQVVKHVVKGEKWACSALKAGKNKPVLFIAKTRDFARICGKIKEKRGFVMNPRFGLSDKT